MKNVLSLIGIAGALFGLSREAHALEKYQSRTRGEQASYSSFASDECQSSSLSVWAFEEIGSGSETSYGGLYVNFYRYDFCAGTYEDGFGYIEASSFDFDRLQSASIDGTGTMDVYSCSYGGGGGGGLRHERLWRRRWRW